MLEKPEVRRRANHCPKVYPTLREKASQLAFYDNHTCDLVIIGKRFTKLMDKQ
jgi:hypothetical protein